MRRSRPGINPIGQPISAAQGLCAWERRYGIRGAMEIGLGDQQTLAFNIGHLDRHTGGAIMC